MYHFFFFTFSLTLRENEHHLFGKGCSDFRDSSEGTSFKYNKKKKRKASLFGLENPQNLSFHLRNLFELKPKRKFVLATGMASSHA